MAQKDVVIQVNKNTPPVYIGVGHLLIVSNEAVHAYQEFRSLTQVETVWTNSTETYLAAQRAFSQTRVPEKIAIVGLAAAATATDIIAELKSSIDAGHTWRAVCYVGFDWDTNTADVTALATWFQSPNVNRMTFHLMTDTNVNRTFAGTLTQQEFTHTVIMLYDTPNLTPDIAEVALGLSYNAGQATFKNLPLRGVTPEKWDFDTEIPDLTAANLQGFVMSAGDVVMTEGLTIGGEYIDVVLGLFWVVENVEYAVQKKLQSAPKIPYTDAGIASIEAVVIDVLSEAATPEMGIIATQDNRALFSTYFPGRDATTSFERSRRNYGLGEFSFELAGAIHTLKPIKALVTV